MSYWSCFRCNTEIPKYNGHLLCPACEVIVDENERRAHLTAAQRAYEDQYGREAQERQTELAKTLYPCCGEPRAGDHHEACSKRPADVNPSVHEGQGALL